MECFSKLANILKSSELPSKLESSNSPVVIVPVLSKKTVFTVFVSSRALAFFKSKPFLAANPVPEIIAVGVANPSAQGQAMTNVATACIIAVSKTPVTAHVIIKVNREITKTIGTKTFESLSANF